MRSTDSVRRRDVLRASGLTAVAALAGCTGGGGGGGSTATDSQTASPTASPTSAGTQSFGGWFDGVKNYDGVVDETGSDAVTVEVGVDNGGQPYGFGPAAVAVSKGTKVTWKWTGKGGSHNVVASDGAFESKLTSEKGFTFSYTFDSTGTYKYFCQPHKALGMKGVVVVK